jgi:hypothetical protein
MCFILSYQDTSLCKPTLTPTYIHRAGIRTTGLGFDFTFLPTSPPRTHNTALKTDYYGVAIIRSEQS